MERVQQRRTLLNEALRYFEMGLCPIPVKPEDKDPPLIKGWGNKKFTREEVLDNFTRNPNANIGLVAGKESRIAIIDIDDPEVIKDKHIPITPQVRTHKGVHLYFQHPGVECKNYHLQDPKNKEGELFSIRCQNQYGIAPPSIHPNGTQYEWVEGLSIFDVPLAPLPEWAQVLIIEEPAHDEASQYFKKRDAKFNDALRNHIQELKQKISFSRHVEEKYGWELTHNARDYKTYNCGFHASTGGRSFTIWDDSGIGIDWHEAKPDWSYDIIKFTQKINGCGFEEAIHILDDYAGIERFNFSSKKASNKAVSTANREDSNKQQNQADRLVELVDSLPVTLFHDEYNEPYARFQVQDHFEIWRIKSKPFKRWIGHQYWKVEKKVPNNEALNAGLNVIEAKACYEGGEYQLHNRVAWHDGAIWYDLGDWRAIKITSQGWEIVDNPPILFRHYSHQMAQVLPQEVSNPNKEIRKIFKYINISNKVHRLLYLTSLVASLIPDIPHPIDVLHGGQGTAKTTSSAIKKLLIDPSQLKAQTFPNTKEEFVRLAAHNWFFFLDNVTGLPQWLSDGLCRIVTGEGFSKRELYTDDDDVIYSFKRCAGLTGINLVPSNPDLLDRSLIFELEPIDETNRKQEKELWKDFEEDKPIILGALFSLLSRTMKEYPEVKLERLPRMADFVVWGCALARAIGLKETVFITAYDININSQNDEAIEASPIAQAIKVFMEDKPSWEGTPTALFTELNSIAAVLQINTRDRKYPQSAQTLWKRIKEVQKNLKAIGILIDKDDSLRYSIGRQIKIKKERKEETNLNRQHDKNDVSVVRLSEIESCQALSTDNTPDNITDYTDYDTDSKDTNEQDTVSHNYPESMDSDNTDNTDIIFETLTEDGCVEEERHLEGCDCDTCIERAWEKELGE